MSKQVNTKTIPQKDEVVMISGRVRKSVDRALELEAARLDIPKAQLIEQALIEKLGLKESSAA